MFDLTPHRIGEFVLMLAFVLIAGAIVIGGALLAVYLARASFQDPVSAPNTGKEPAGGGGGR